MSSQKRCAAAVAGWALPPELSERGVVVQERAGETVILAVALDLRVTTERSRTDLTFVVRVVGGA